MPAYDYRCPSCDCVFEVTRGIRETGAIACPECGAEAKRLFSPVGIVFKGTGFHNTDYRAKKAIPAPSESAPAGEKKAEKPACGGDGSSACASCPAAE
ncbi:MAG: FmdB family transcriptional regulator [Actinobacteria bacterium HGW-Actinobacteria-1]|jgi:putative FmdB family regulatory protein|nr:MAG: FmdB family transcriptional regulator [Actinobacteria bacterium HGW-Actinobacteria-1]